MAMASTSPFLLRLQIAILFSLLALSVSATARPCRTFFISTRTITFPAIHRRYLPPDHNPSPASVNTVTEIRSFIPVYFVGNYHNDNPSIATRIFFDRALPGDHGRVQFQRHASHVRAPLGFSAYDFSSLRDRTKDILSVVVALLFGVGCGALTAATMYLVWSVFSNRYDGYRASYDDYVDDDNREYDEIESPKKMGYVKIPAPEAVPPPAKEAV